MSNNRTMMERQTANGRGDLSLADIGPYTPDDWEEECYRDFGEGRDPAPCPACGRTGFYGPRIGDGEYHYRQCRFCGFTQGVGEAPVTARASMHDCEAWPQCAKAPYIWWVSPERDTLRCPLCGEDVDVAAHQVTRPVDDPEHPWWRVPQRRRRSYYTRFWENWEFTRGRAFL